MFQEENENEINKNNEKIFSNEIFEKEKSISNLGIYSNEDLNSNYSDIDSNYQTIKKNKELLNYVKQLSENLNLPSPEENINYTNEYEDEIDLTIENKEKLFKIIENISLCLNFNIHN